MSLIPLLSSHTRQRIVRVVIGALASVILLVVIAPELARNLAMLAYLRHWTKANDNGLTRLAPLFRWWVSIERANPLLLAQASAVMRTLGDDEIAAETLRTARSLAPITQRCDSQDAMQIEHLARSLLPIGSTPKMLAFVTHAESTQAISQMRSVFAEDGGFACMHVLTAVIPPTDSSAYAAMRAALPVQPGRRYRIEVECYIAGSLQSTLEALGDSETSASIFGKDAWTTTRLETTPQQAQLLHLQVIARSGAGRIACRDAAITDTASPQ